MMMMYTPLKFESEEAARSQVEPLQIQPRLMLEHDGHRWLRYKTLQKQFLREGWKIHKPCARQRGSLANNSFMNDWPVTATTTTAASSCATATFWATAATATICLPITICTTTRAKTLKKYYFALGGMVLLAVE